MSLSPQTQTPVQGPWPALTLPTADITIVGLGPGPVAAVPLGVWHLLHSERSVILRTRQLRELRRSVRGGVRFC